MASTPSGVECGLWTVCGARGLVLWNLKAGTRITVVLEPRTRLQLEHLIEHLQLAKYQNWHTVRF